MSYAGEGLDSNSKDRDDERAAYRLTLTKWAKGSMAAITSCIFWVLLYLCRALRGPLRHFMLLVQKEARAGECMFKLVTGKLDQLTREFQTLFENLPEVVNKALAIAGCLDPDKGLSNADILKVRYIAMRLLLLHWAAFRRRIIRPLQQFPLKLLWLIKSPPKRYCDKRKAVAAEVLQLDSCQLDASTQKIRRLCERELHHLKDNGVFPDVASQSGSFLYALLKGLAKMVPADTQAIEGINSVIKLVGRRCPNISLELLSSRLTVRRSLSEDGSMRRSKKWSSIKTTAEAMFQTIAGYNTATLAILADGSRWSTPLAVGCGSDRDQKTVLAITDKLSLQSVCGRDIFESHPSPTVPTSSTASASGADRSAASSGSGPPQARPTLEEPQRQPHRC